MRKGWFTHVWGDEHPLGKFVCLEIFVKHGKIFDIGQTVEIVGYRVVDDGGIFIQS